MAVERVMQDEIIDERFIIDRVCPNCGKKMMRAARTCPSCQTHVGKMAGLRESPSSPASAGELAGYAIVALIILVIFAVPVRGVIKVVDWWNSSAPVQPLTAAQIAAKAQSDAKLEAERLCLNRFLYSHGGAILTPKTYGTFPVGQGFETSIYGDTRESAGFDDRVTCHVEHGEITQYDSDPGFYNDNAR